MVRGSEAARTLAQAAAVEAPTDSGNGREEAVGRGGNAAGDRRGGDRPERQLFALLGDGSRGTVATAESLTGGGVAARLTAVAGSSAYVLGGIVAYANGAKADLLGVPPEILETRGAVSAECARAMAAGARLAFGSDWAVATTGIAGPGGATARKPVGLVYVAAAGVGFDEVEEHHFEGDRAAVTAASVEAALRLLLAAVVVGSRNAPREQVRDDH
jgi:PncC family amidohydrolase